MPSFIDKTLAIMNQLVSGVFVMGMEEQYADEAVN